MNLTYSIIIIVLIYNSFLYPWRIENNYLIIEKGDNLWEIAHSFYGGGIYYKDVWDLRVDTVRFKNPDLVYDGMKFYIPNKYFVENLPKTSDTLKCDSNKNKIDSIISIIDSSNKILKNIEENTGYSSLEFILEKILLSLALSTAGGVITWIIIECKAFRRIFNK